MHRKEIVYFDELGFGWVVDRSVMKELHDHLEDRDAMVEKTLADLLRHA